MSRGTRVPEHLVERLYDPFDVFPLVHALHALGNVIEEFNDTLYSQHEDVAPKYRDVGLDQGLEAVSIVIGAGFVAAQSILTSTFSNVKRLSELDGVRLAGGAGLPRAKRELFQIAAYDRNGVPDIVGINALANYFKHASEWSHDWNGLTRPLEIFWHSEAAMDSLSWPRLQEWRESIEAEIRSRLIDADLLS